MKQLIISYDSNSEHGINISEIKSWTSRSSIGLLGFSVREVQLIRNDDEYIEFKVKEDLYDEFIIALAEATSIDFWHASSYLAYPHEQDMADIADREQEAKMCQ